jgi:hypothetical protein
MQTLDATVETSVDFLKIDVEGGEAEVLLGATEILKNHHPTLFVEVHPQFLSDERLMQVFDIVASHYEKIELYHRGGMNVVDKIKDQYLSADPLTRVHDPDRYIGDRVDGKGSGTFWVVGHGSC